MRRILSTISSVLLVIAASPSKAENVRFHCKFHMTPANVDREVDIEVNDHIYIENGDIMGGTTKINSNQIIHDEAFTNNIRFHTVIDLTSGAFLRRVVIPDTDTDVVGDGACARREPSSIAENSNSEVDLEALKKKMNAICNDDHVAVDTKIKACNAVIDINAAEISNAFKPGILNLAPK